MIKISTIFLLAHFLALLIFLLYPLYLNLGLGDPRPLCYLAWALFFPAYFLLKLLEDSE